MAVLPTASPTDIKLIIISIYSVGDVLKIRRQTLNFAPKFLITLHIFRSP
jgi:flagellar biosynthesis protein FliQ